MRQSLIAFTAPSLIRLPMADSHFPLYLQQSRNSSKSYLVQLDRPDTSCATTASGSAWSNFVLEGLVPLSDRYCSPQCPALCLRRKRSPVLRMTVRAQPHLVALEQQAERRLVA